jgi:hypothetical protein
MKEARDSISQAVEEIKETVEDQYDTVKRTVDGVLAGRDQFQKDPIVWSVGALAAGFALGYTLGYTHKTVGRSRGSRSEVGAFADSLIDELSAVGNSLVMPSLNSKLKELFGFDFADMLEEIGSAKGRISKKTTARKALTKHGTVAVREDTARWEQESDAGRGEVRSADDWPRLGRGCSWPSQFEAIAPVSLSRAERCQPPWELGSGSAALATSTPPRRSGSGIRSSFSPAPSTPHQHATSNHGDAHPGRNKGRSTKAPHQRESGPTERIAGEDERVRPERGRPKIPGEEAAVADAMGTRDGPDEHPHSGDEAPDQDDEAAIAPQIVCGVHGRAHPASSQPSMERVEASARQPPSEVPEVVTHHRAPEAGRNRADEVHAAGGGEDPRGQQD